MRGDRPNYEEAIVQMHFKSTDPNNQPDALEIRERQQKPADGKIFYVILAVVTVASFLFGIYFRGN
ncbi:MAG: hypothetical protein NXI13_08800 [Proteobacteria bacterium]|nr:hypothetical protein [Pseudomonadota bacterium]